MRCSKCRNQPMIGNGMSVGEHIKPQHYNSNITSCACLHPWYFSMIMIIREVGLRVSPSMRSAFMSSPRNYSFANGSIFVSYHQVKPCAQKGNWQHYVTSEAGKHAGHCEHHEDMWSAEVLHWADGDLLHHWDAGDGGCSAQGRDLACGHQGG